MISLEGVSKAYRTRSGRRTVLDNVNVTFEGGYNFGVLGVNGAGIGFGGTFHGALSGRENVAFIARIYGAGMRGVLEYVEGFCELGNYFHMPVNTCSAGMRARLAFATCLALDFDLYLIDEVTEVGDQRFRQKCAEAFRERMQRSDIILVTHNIHTLRQYCDRGAILDNGELTLFDDIGTALGRYHRMVQERL
jgi:capsular polysaccharide transport system ATP-binding protein